MARLCSTHLSTPASIPCSRRTHLDVGHEDTRSLDHGRTPPVRGRQQRDLFLQCKLGQKVWNVDKCGRSHLIELLILFSQAAIIIVEQSYTAWTDATAKIETFPRQGQEDTHMGTSRSLSTARALGRRPSLLDVRRSIPVSSTVLGCCTVEPITYGRHAPPAEAKLLRTRHAVFGANLRLNNTRLRRDRPPGP